MPDEFGSLYKNSDVSMEAFLSLGIGCILLIVLVIFLHKRYMRYVKEREFLDEISTLEMEQSESDTLLSLVRRYALNEPVDILYSQRLFDELAVKEISRVLGSPLSKENKTKFVNMIYNIRQKTYNQSLTPEAPTFEAAEPEKAAEPEPTTASS
ncbi:MAG: hypothetical protein P9L94_19870 [Candidatus Hinthialibacter antarcticus]|nr:hypothetical protein [Candidatus Hinthialibacter antarcticus]